MKTELLWVSIGVALLYVAWQVHQQRAAAPGFIRVNQSFDATTLDWWS